MSEKEFDELVRKIELNLTTDIKSKDSRWFEKTIKSYVEKMVNQGLSKHEIYRKLNSVGDVSSN